MLFLIHVYTLHDTQLYVQQDIQIRLANFFPSNRIKTNTNKIFISVDENISRHDFKSVYLKPIQG